MRILGWVQNKFNGRQEKKRFDAGSSSIALPDVSKKEFSDWPQAFLSIGTFGTKDMKEEQQISENLDSPEDLPDFTTEEVDKLQKELARLLSRKPKSNTCGSEITGEDRVNLPLNRFLNCPSSWEVDRTASMKVEDFKNDNHGDLSPNTKIILNKVKDALSGNHNAIKKKSLSFLLKKIFVCSGGFEPPQSLRGPTAELRIEKMLKAVVTKKIYPQSSAPTSMKKYLEKEPTEKMQAGKEEEDKRKDQCRWVKTDSEYIVLEI